MSVHAWASEPDVLPVIEEDPMYFTFRDVSAPVRARVAGDNVVSLTATGRLKREVAPVLPATEAPLVGRETDLAAALALVRQESVRLVTLTGPGGVGKTRLALEVARAYGMGEGVSVRLVSLAALTDPAGLLAEIARQIGADLASGDRSLAAIISSAGELDLLLVLDNLEQVVAGAAQLAALLAALPRVKMLATSRTALRIRAERELPLAPLALPGPDDDLTAMVLEPGPAVALFVERARAVNPAFALTTANVADVAAIVRRLDGLPLAIELAAARCRILSPKALLARLDRRLTVLTDGPGDLPDRQRTLNRSIAWSYDLLSPVDQALFRCLAVIGEPFTIAAAEAVAGAPAGDEALLAAVERLVAQSLLMREPGAGEARLRMLATVREFALARLTETGELATVTTRYTRWRAAHESPGAASVESVAVGVARDNMISPAVRRVATDGVAPRRQVLRPTRRTEVILTPREVEVLRHVAAGLTNAEVADRLFVSPRTIHAHLGRIYDRLGVSNRAGATRFAAEHGLV